MPPAGPSGPKRRRLQADRQCVRTGMDESDAASLPGEGSPVVPAGDRRRDSGRRPNADQHRRARCRSGKYIEHGLTRPGPDRDVDEDRMQRMSEPHAMEKVGYPPPEQTAHTIAETVGYGVEAARHLKLVEAPRSEIKR